MYAYLGICMCTTCVQEPTQANQKISDFLELEKYMVLSRHVSAEIEPCPQFHLLGCYNKIP